MPLHLETLAESAALPAAPAKPSRWHLDPADWPVAVLALMMLLVPALGVPSELMVQDTLKSALVAFGVLIAALVFFWQQRQRTAPLLWHGLMWLTLALMAYALGSMVWSHTYLAGVEAIRWFILSLLLWLGLNAITRQNFSLLVWGIHGGLFIASMWVVLQFTLNFGLFPQVAPPSATFINRNFFAEYAVCVLPFSIYLLANMRSWQWSVPMSLSLMINVVALMMTGTRSALIALLVLLPIFGLILIRYRRQFRFCQWSRAAATMVVLVLVSGIVGIGSVPTRDPRIMQENNGTTGFQRSFKRTQSIAAPAEYTEGSFSFRKAMWKDTIRMINAHPWSGVGAGAWVVQIPLYQPLRKIGGIGNYAHNEFLQCLSEYGLPVGGLFLAVLFAYLILTADKTWRLSGVDLTEAPLRALTLSSLLALLVVSNAGFPWHLATTCAMLALGLGILAGSDARLGNKEAFFSAPLRWRPGFSKAMLVCLLGCTVLTLYITQQAQQAEVKILTTIKLASRGKKPVNDNEKQWAQHTAEIMKNARESIAINPDYYGFIASLAEYLTTSGDLTNATLILETVAASRPNIVTVWAALAQNYTQLGQNQQALRALTQWDRLEPHSPGARALHFILLNRTGHQFQAVQILNEHFSNKIFDYDLVQAGYQIGLENHDWPLAIQSLELGIHSWPEQAADGYFKLGKIYADPQVHDDTKALAAFRAGLLAAPAGQKDNFRQQIPESYRVRL